MWWVQSAAEEARFERARKMTEVESRKQYEFLEAMVSSMDAHLRFFERGHEVKPPPPPSPPPPPRPLPLALALAYFTPFAQM